MKHGIDRNKIRNHLTTSSKSCNLLTYLQILSIILLSQLQRREEILQELNADALLEENGKFGNIYLTLDELNWAYQVLKKRESAKNNDAKEVAVSEQLKYGSLNSQ